MPIQHGSKYYCQLLIDPNRYKLAEKIALSEGVKVTAVLRDLVYDGLERHYSAAEYEEARQSDEDIWRESIKRRVEGRLRSKRVS